MKNARFDIKLSQEHKTLVQKAAKAMGITASAFFVMAAVKEAKTVMGDRLFRRGSKS